jgi:hypothetical protein
VGFVVSLAFLIAAFAVAASKAHAEGAKKEPAGAAPPTAEDHVRKIIASGDPRKMAAAAITLHQAGETEAASAVAKHATGILQKQLSASRQVVYPSPFPGVQTPAWSSWVHAQRGDDPKAITSGYYLGLFRMGMRRLVDLGLATNPHHDKWQGKSVWMADWVAPLQPGPDVYLSDPDLQYKSFAKAVSDDLAHIQKELPEAVGADVDGTKATASGLLAVTKLTGVSKLKEWLSDPELRKKYPQTMAVFNKLNGVF